MAFHVVSSNYFRDYFQSLEMVLYKLCNLCSKTIFLTRKLGMPCQKSVVSILIETFAFALADCPPLSTLQYDNEFKILDL